MTALDKRRSDSVDRTPAERYAETIARDEAGEGAVTFSSVLADMRGRKDAAYRERNQLVAALSKIYPAHLCQHDVNDASWDREWLTIVCIHSPVGQLTWHLHDLQVGDFAHLAMGENHWDGHTTDEKYRRLASLTAQNVQPQLGAVAVAPPVQGHQAHATLIAELMEIIARARFHKVHVHLTIPSLSKAVFSVSTETLRSELLAALASGGAHPPPEQTLTYRQIAKWGPCENGDCRDHYGDELAWCIKCRGGAHPQEQEGPPGQPRS